MRGGIILRDIATARPKPCPAHALPPTASPPTPSSGGVTTPFVPTACSPGSSPRHYTAPQPAWETRENTVAAPPAPGLRITTPADRAIIENRGQTLTLQTDGGVPPYTWLANRQLLRQTHSPQTLWQPPGDGDYTLDVSDQNGNHARIHIRLQTPPERPATTVRLQPAH